MLAAQTAAPLHIVPAPEPAPSRLLTRLRLPRATAVALALLLDGVCAEPEARPAPEGHTSRPSPDHGRAPQEL